MDLAPEDIAKLAEKLKPLSLPKGAVLFQQGDPGDSFYLITSGQVRVVKPGSSGEEVAAFLGRGDSLGEMSLLTGEPRATAVRLDTTCEFLTLEKKDFEEVLRGNPSVVLHLSRLLSRRLMMESRTGAAGAAPKASSPKLVAFLSATPTQEATLLAALLSVALVEQTRRRVLMAEVHAEAGALSTSLGLKPTPTSEGMLREQDLRDPATLRRMSLEHPSGLEVLCLPAKLLGGRLFRGIFLLTNTLRENYDICLVWLGTDLGDVEKSILAEADRWMLVGSESSPEAFGRVHAALKALPDGDQKLTPVWLGQSAPSGMGLDVGSRLPWPAALSAEWELTRSPFSAVLKFPKTERAVGGLARRLAGVRVGIALGSGAALGHSLIGVLKALEREHVPVDLLAGTSMGALVGGFYALGMPVAEIEEVALRLDKAWMIENLFWDITIPRSGFFGGTTLLRFLRSYHGEREFQDLEVPFSCVATDIETGEEVVLKEGRVAEAIRASCGLPLVFNPLFLNGRYLVDGGLVNPVPTRVVSEMGADILVSVNLTLPAGERKSVYNRRLREKEKATLPLPKALKAPGLFSVLFKMIYTMEYEIARSRVDLGHVVIHPEIRQFGWTEMYRAKELIELGEEACEEALPKIKSYLPYFSDYCQVPIKPSPRIY